MKNRLAYFFIVTLFCFAVLSTNKANAQVFINEVVASNSQGLQDEDGDYPDWIELYNSGNTDVNVEGYGISDDADNRFKYVLPELILQPDSYYLLYASDKNRSDSANIYVHLNFKLSSEGESVYLTSPESILVDSLTYPGLKANESFGRASGEEANYYIFPGPTPLSENPADGYLKRLEKPTVAQPGGFYPGPVDVSLQNIALAAQTYFTTDGTDPTKESQVFGSNPRTFNQTTVLKLRVIAEGQLSSEITVQTYFVNDAHDLPVVSLVTEPDNFFDENEGIYIQFEEDIEVPAHIEFFEENGSPGFKSHVGTKIFGSYSRRFDQKSFSIFFRGEYGFSELDYQLFEEKGIDTFQSFILRNAGNDFGAAHMRDAAMTTIVGNEVDIDYQAYRPAVLYLNGEYWGIQNIREKISEHFIASNHNINPEDVDLIEATEDPVAKNGTTDLYLDFLVLLENADMTNQEDYESVIQQIDLENFIDYMAIETFYANTDWPGTNVKLWRDRGPEGKWRWILYDTDHGFNLYSGEGDFDLDMFEHTMQTDPSLLKYSNPLWATSIFRKLMENQEFKNQFIIRVTDLMNTVFRTDHMLAVIDSLAGGIESEMPAHEERWDLISGWTSEGPFMSQVEDMRDFARRRSNYMTQHMQTHFELSDLQDITVDISDKRHGSVMINRAEPKSYPWTGQYFENIKVPVTALPETGYKFTGWSGSTTSNVMTVEADAGDNLIASFEPISGFTSDIVINEIMYNAPDEEDPEDWIELYNTTSTVVDLSGWMIKDEDDSHIFEFTEGTEIQAKEYLVAAQDLDSFNQFYSNVSPLYGDLDFGLAGGSDQVRVFNASGDLIDIVSYDDDDPWPSDADGTGYSLELKNPGLDNFAPESWQASSQYEGTPGASNSVFVANEGEEEIPVETALHQNYPNPFNPATVISYQVSINTEVRLEVFDALGRKVASLVDGRVSAGEHQVQFNASNLSSGVYIYRIKAEDFSQTRKMLLVK